MKKPKRVLLLNAAVSEERLIAALKELGCHVITSGNRPDHPGHRLADEYAYGNYADKDAIYNLAVRLKVDAVCPCAGDYSVTTAAYVSEKLGLPGQDSYETTLTIHSKDRFAAFASRLGGIRTPHAVSFSNLDSALTWADNTEHDFPLIVKPADMDGGIGIQRADSLLELQENIRLAFEKSRAKCILVEQFIEGTQHGFCTFLIDQKVAAVSSNNEYSVINPYQVEIDTFPGDNTEAVRNDLIAQIERIAQVLHLSDGIFHLQYILRDGKPYIIECMRRILGNIYGLLAEKADGGLRWEYWEARAKCGFGCDGFPPQSAQTKKGFAAYRKLVAERNGIYEGIDIPEDIRKHVFMERIIREPGHEINNHMTDMIGLLFMQFSSRQEMMETMLDRASEIQVLVR